jgi:HSP20 family protein
MSMLDRLKIGRTTPPARTGDHPLASLHRDMDRLFEEFLGRFETPTAEWFGTRFPVMDVEASDAQVTVKVDLPGMDAADVKVTLENGALVISGEKSEERVEEKDRQDDERRWLVKERMHGAFRRVIALPADADVGAIDANFSQGVLTIAMPRRVDESSGPRTVEVKTK